jgi:outer membrane protein assembly factor BamB
MREIASPLPPRRIHPRHKWRCILRGSHNQWKTGGFGDYLYGSPVGADGKVYIASRNETTLVIKHGPQYEVLSTNKLDDSFSASPVIVDNELYLRGEKNLYCIAEK